MHSKPSDRRQQTAGSRRKENILVFGGLFLLVPSPQKSVKPRINRYENCKMMGLNKQEIEVMEEKDKET